MHTYITNLNECVCIQGTCLLTSHACLWHSLKHFWKSVSESHFSTVVTLLWISSSNSKKKKTFGRECVKITRDQIRRIRSIFYNCYLFLAKKIALLQLSYGNSHCYDPQCTSIATYSIWSFSINALPRSLNVLCLVNGFGE